MQPQANRDRIIIRTSLPPSLPQVVADARSVRQIVLNLLSNSIKFTDAGGQVIVSTALNDNGDVALRVRDTGVGMSEKDLATALEPFRQLANSVSGVPSGTGLGLPLTRRWRKPTVRASTSRARQSRVLWSKLPFRRVGCWRGETPPRRSNFLWRAWLRLPPPAFPNSCDPR
jgi:K+-sensing histidine kinase KdpD